MSKTEISATAQVQRRTDLAAQDLDGDLVMADIHAGQFYGLGASAKRIWELIETPRTVDDLCHALVQEYDVDKGECEKDVREFLGELSQAGLIRIGS